MTTGTGGLSTTAYLVLGMIARHGTATPYAVKSAVRDSIGEYWPIPHAQLYTVPDQLESQGLLESEREASGRRRESYRVTETGHRALPTWLGDPGDPPGELRSVAWLKLLFSDFAGQEDIARLAVQQAERHRARIARQLDTRNRNDEPAARLSVQLTLEIDKAALNFWHRPAQRGALGGH
jgi:DNA-binding PadR family transcriptional regulator